MIFLGRAFFVLIILEILTFGMIVGAIGFWAALAAWFASAALGGFLIQNQGLKNLQNGHRHFQMGVLPEEALFDNFCLLAAGLLLIFPGFVSDGLAFLLLIPPVRAKLKAWLFKKLSGKGGATGFSRNGDIIEGEYVRVEEVRISSNPSQPPQI